MKLLMRYQMNYLRFNFIFGIVAYIVIALLLKEDLLTSPESLAMYGLILSLLYNYYSFLTTHEFRRMLFTLPISTKDIIKTIFLSSIIFTTFIFFVAAITAIITMQFYEMTLDPFIGILIALPVTWIVMGVKHYALLRSKIEGDFGWELLVYLGVVILFAVPVITLIFSLPNEFFGYYIGLLFILCIAITYFTYKLCCKHADRIYVVVRNEGSKKIHDSIHSEQYAELKR